jgi:iturin family lipopeptide synthetase A/iturin family lipopeptide synthetase C/tyrocidine synthetase-3
VKDGLLSEREHRQLVVAYNDSGSPYPADKTIVELFEAQASDTPEAEAIRLAARSMTYGELNARANQMAASAGLGRPGGLLSPCTWAFDRVVCAAGVPGHAATVRRPASRRNGSPLLGGHPGRRGTGARTRTNRGSGSLPVGGVGGGGPLDADFASIASLRSRTPAGGDRDGLAYVIYTSGSTDRRAMIEHRSLPSTTPGGGQRSTSGASAWPGCSSLIAFDLHGDLGLHAAHLRGSTIARCGTENWCTASSGSWKTTRWTSQLTPAHPGLIMTDLGATRFKTHRGGEDFKTELARDVTRQFGRPVEIYNEYGPTEPPAA